MHRQYPPNPGLSLWTAASILSPPNKQEILQDLVFQPVLFLSVLQELEGVRDFLLIKVVGSTFSKGCAKSVT